MNLFWIVSGVFLGASLLTVGGPILGEMLATLPPLRSPQRALAVRQLGLFYEEVSFETSEGLTLRGWFFPAQQPDSPAVLYAPATAHDQVSGLSLVRPLHEAGYHVLLFSYRGHGDSEGDPLGFTYGAEESKDVDAALRYLVEERGVRHVAGIGHSAGAVALLLSAARNPRLEAVVAASPYPSLEEIWETNRPSFFPKVLHRAIFRLVEWRKGFSRYEIQVDEAIAAIAPRPVLLIHGSEDRRVTLAQAVRLFERAGAPKQLWVVAGAGHHQVRYPALDRLMDRIIPFLAQALLPNERCLAEDYEGLRRIQAR